MSWKTITLDVEAYHLLKKAKQKRESFGDVVRRIVTAREPIPDIETHLDQLFRDFGGVGVMPEAALTRLEQRKKHPPRSPQPRHAA